jgi:hypothetical protein
MYQHTQSGTLIWILCLTSLIFLLIGVGMSMNSLKQAGTIFPSDQTILLRLTGGMFVMAMILVLFFRLTVTVDEHYIRAVFGIGIIGKRIPLGDITGVRSVTNPWWYGWGIHMIPGGWIWNISGTQAVELKLKSGRLLRLGTDEPKALIEAIRTQNPVV